MRIFTTLLFFLFNPVQAENTSDITCSQAPGHLLKLCWTANQNFKSGMLLYTNTVYIQDEQKRLRLHIRDKDSISALTHIGFSDNGLLMYIESADEGHPYFTFYKTVNYLGYGKRAKSLATLDDYFLDTIKGFTAEGLFIYSRSRTTDAKCADISGYVLNKKAKQKVKNPSGLSPCYKVFRVTSKIKN